MLRSPSLDFLILRMFGSRTGAWTLDLTEESSATTPRSTARASGNILPCLLDGLACLTGLPGEALEEPPLAPLTSPNTAGALASCLAAASSCLAACGSGVAGLRGFTLTC